MQVETAASTTSAVVGTRFDVPLATRVEERVSVGLPASTHASPAGARRTRPRREHRKCAAICRRFKGICEAELLLAMQKVEGSNPFSRSPESLAVVVDAEAPRGVNRPR